MKDVITITSKGQTTLPIEVRRKLGLDATGGVLSISFNEQAGVLVVTKAKSLAELSARVSTFVRPGTIPVTSVDEFYQAHRDSEA